MEENMVTEINEGVANEIVASSTNGGNVLIKVGVAVGAVALIGGIVCLIKRRKKAKKAEVTEVEYSEVEVETTENEE